MRSKIGVLLLVTGIALLLFGSGQAVAADPQVLISCNGTVSTPSPAKVILKGTGRSVEFKAAQSCNTVTVTGTGPIGTFTLLTNETKTIAFTTVGTYTYTTDGHAKAPMGAGSIVVTAGAPALTTFGLGILVLLLMAAAIWLFRRRHIVPVS